MILVSGASCVYILVKNINEELERFIETGKTQATELNVFSKEQEQTLIRHFSKEGKIITYHSQQIEYMYHQGITIKYLQICDPVTNMKISLIPWFLIPGRPYPIFTYIYAILHYYNTGKKSLKQSALATGILFGIEKFNKSTVSRSIKAFEKLIDITGIDRPLAINEEELPFNEDVIGCITEIFTNCLSIESLEEMYGEMVRHLPTPVNYRQTINHVLSGVPDEYSKVINEKVSDEKKPKDVRIRPTRQRSNNKQPVQRHPNTVDTEQIKNTRKAFISICKHLVLDMAVTYHRFLN